MNRSTIATFAALCASILCVSGAAHAAIFCANNSTELRHAFSSVGSNGQHDEIRIRNISMPASAAMLAQSTYYAVVSDGKDIAISGGWTDNFCTQQTPDPAATELRPFAGRRLIEFSTFATPPPAQPTISMRNLSLTGDGVYSPRIGQGVLIGGPSKFRLERSIISDFDSFSGAIATEGHVELVVIQGNLFTGNAANYAAAVRLESSTSTSASMNFSNNTLVYNTIRQQEYIVSFSGGITTHYENNVLWDNDYATFSGEPREMQMSAFPSFTLRNNLWQYPRRGGFNSDYGSLNADPQFTSPTNFRPSATSPLRNAGVIDVVGGVLLKDLAGLGRVQENAVDIGAYEYDPDRIFSSGFD